MCSDPDSTPPIEPGPSSSANGRRVVLEAADGVSLAAFRADASEPTGVGIVVLPDYYGLTAFYEDLALRFAEAGIDAMAIDYYGRTAAPPPRDSSFDHVDHAGRTSWTGLQADVAAAVSELRAERRVRALFSIGFCFGGRTSFLLGTVPELDLAGVIGFYGWPVGEFRNDTLAPATVTSSLRAPLLGIFGEADPKIPPTDVMAFERALDAAPVPHRVISYEGAPHSFFDRKQEDHAAASGAAWSEVLAFIEAYRPAPGR